MNLSPETYRRIAANILGGVALAYYWRGHGALRTVGAFILGSWVTSAAVNVISPPSSTTEAV